MATANAEDFSDLHERVLRFMGAFQRPSSPRLDPTGSPRMLCLALWRAVHILHP
jgi:hypothetical protein